MEEIKKVIAELREKYRDDLVDLNLSIAERHIGYLEGDLNECNYVEILRDLKIIATRTYDTYRRISQDDQFKLISAEAKLLNYIGEALIERCGCEKL